MYVERVDALNIINDNSNNVTIDHIYTNISYSEAN